MECRGGKLSEIKSKFSGTNINRVECRDKDGSKVYSVQICTNINRVECRVGWYSMNLLPVAVLI